MVTDIVDLSLIERTALLVAVVLDIEARSRVEERRVIVAIGTRRIELQLRLVLIEHRVLTRRNRDAVSLRVVRAIAAELEYQPVDLVLDGVLRMDDIAMTGRGLDGVRAALVLEGAALRLDEDIGRARADDLPAGRNRDVAAVLILDIDGGIISLDNPRDVRSALRLDGNARRGRDIAEILDLVRPREIYVMCIYFERRNGFQDTRRGDIFVRLDGYGIGKPLGQVDITDLDIACIRSADADFAEALAVGILTQESRAAEDVGRKCGIGGRAARAGRAEVERLARRIGIEGDVAVPCDRAAVRRVELVRLDGDVTVMIAVGAVGIDMRIVEIDFTAGDGIVPAVRLDRAGEVDAALAARDRLLDVDGERHVDRAALVKASAAPAVTDVDDLILPELTVVAIEILVEQRELRGIVHFAAELDVAIVRDRQDIERLLALHLAVEVDRVGLERECARARIDIASRRRRQIL